MISRRDIVSFQELPVSAGEVQLQRPIQKKICYNTNYIPFHEGRNYVEMHSMRLRV